MDPRLGSQPSHQTRSERTPPAVQVVASDEEITPAVLRAFAQRYVALLLAQESITTAPPAVSTASELVTGGDNG